MKQRGGAFTALDEVSLQIEKGTVVGYLGPNGAGKTTTIKILAKLITPTSGRAYINGIDVTDSSQEVLRSVGMLIEVPGTYDYLTPHEMLYYFGMVHRIGKKNIDRRIEETLQLVDLLDWEHKKIGTFSTGMQRRVALAKAVLHRPEILILDEPVLGLDPKGIRDVRELIRRFKSEGMTVFLSSHLLGEVSEVCDEVIFLDKGKVIESDGMDDIAKTTVFESVKVRFSRPLTSDELESIRSIKLASSVEMTDSTVRIQLAPEPESIYQVLRELVALNFEIISYNPEGKGLEDYYISIMGN
ncbi:MAG: ABC transporter ATP-binding protein [Chloroflexota bacterium]|nr:ABC transporter ATP-binding protein [Chloroflexota bacterium]